MVDVPLSGAQGSVCIVWERAGWQARGRRGDPALAIAGQAFPRLTELVWRAGHSLSVGLALTDEHLAQAWREAGVRPEADPPTATTWNRRAWGSRGGGLGPTAGHLLRPGL